MEEYDVVVLGGGVAGVSAAIRAVELGARTCLIEANEIGGNTVSSGYLTKFAIQILSTLNHAGAMASQLEISEGSNTPPKITRLFELGLSRTQEITQSWTKNLTKRKVSLIQGEGRIAGKNKILVVKDKEETVIQTKSTIIATGSTPSDSPTVPFDGQSIVSCDDIFRFQRTPENVLIIGGERIGCEIATLFNGLGSRVFLTTTSLRLLTGYDPEILSEYEEGMRKQKIKLLLNKKLNSVFKNGEQLEITLEGGIKFSVDKLVFAHTWKGNTSATTQSGIDLGEHQEILVDESLKTTAPDVYAAGSVTGRAPDPYLSGEEGRVAAENALGKQSRLNPDKVPTIIHSIPQVAKLGCFEDNAHHKGYRGIAGQCRMKGLDYNILTGKTTGVVKLVADKSTKKVIGAHIFGDEVSELMSQALFAVNKGLTLKDIVTLSGGWPDRFQGLKKAAISCLRKLAQSK